MCYLRQGPASYLSEARYKTVSFFGSHYVIIDPVQRLAGVCLDQTIE